MASVEQPASLSVPSAHSQGAVTGNVVSATSDDPSSHGMPAERDGGVY